MSDPTSLSSSLIISFHDLRGDFLAEQVDEKLVGDVSRLSGFASLSLSLNHYTASPLPRSRGVSTLSIRLFAKKLDELEFPLTIAKKEVF